MVPYITPYITKKQKHPTPDHDLVATIATIFSRRLPIEVFRLAHPPPPRQWKCRTKNSTAAARWEFSPTPCWKIWSSNWIISPFKEWKWKILQTTAQIQVHETVIRRMHPEPPNSCFFSERSLIIKDMLGIYIVYIKPMTIRSWIPFEAKHIGCMHATVKCQNHWCTNFFTSSHIL